MPVAPHALLLDFGGVLVDAPTRPSIPPDLVQRAREVVQGAVLIDQIIGDLTDGAREYAAWRDAVSAEESPTEQNHEQLWGDFITFRWPESAREAVRREATPLSYAWTWQPDWAVRVGIPKALRAAAERGLPMAVVSNTLCGAAHRDFLHKANLAEFFVVQLYSDETGSRKPSPEMAVHAAHALGIAIEQCWFIGDSLNRDIVCARRAGVGSAVLMRSPRTDREGPLSSVTPDAVVEDGYGLLELLNESPP